MLYRTVLPALVCASVAFAIPAPEHLTAAEIGATFTSALSVPGHRGLRARQNAGTSAEEITNALSNLAGMIQQVTSGEKCTSECNPWLTGIQSCVANNEDEEAIGICVCGEDRLADQEACGQCFDQAAEVSNFRNVCQAGLAALSSTSLSSPSGVTRSSTNSAAASRTTSADSDSSAAATASQSMTSAGAPSQSATSAAGQTSTCRILSAFLALAVLVAA